MKRRFLASLAMCALAASAFVGIAPRAVSAAKPGLGDVVQVHVSNVAGSMVLGNLTVTEPEGAGFTTAYPCAEGRPLASNNNYEPGQTTPNFVAVRADVNGNVCLYTSASAHLIWDQVAELPGLPAHNANRLLDTRNGDNPPPLPRRVFVVYGDSLTMESTARLADRLGELLPDWTILIRSYGGTAQCDYTDAMVQDAETLDVGGVMLAFSGNNLTPCIQSRPYIDGYTADAEWAATFWGSQGVPLVFVAAPGAVGTALDSRTVPNIYRDVGAARGVTVADTTPLFASGSPPVYQFTMPCLVGECDTTILVRRLDGHLCPIDSSGLPCPVYSSGVVRYVETMIHGAASALGVAQPPYRTMVEQTKAGAAVSTSPTTPPTTSTTPPTTSTTSPTTSPTSTTTTPTPPS